MFQKQAGVSQEKLFKNVKEKPNISHRVLYHLPVLHDQEML